MPHPSSQVEPLRPSLLLALVCAAVVRAFDPSWLSRPVADLARMSGIRPERVCRLWRRLLAPFERLLARAATPGRRRKERSPAEGRSREDIRDALLAVACEVIRGMGGKKRKMQDFLVAARDRLKAEWGLAHRDFCRLLGLPERTVRHWAGRGVPTPRPPVPVDPPPRPGDRRVGRFDLAVTLPGVQGMADTTAFSLFDVPLKIVALQDPGDRHRRLWEAFALEETENAEVVVRVVADALKDRPGTQLLTDQGTPYLAKATEDALAELEVDHAPQKEGTPTAKATLERSFRTVKDALAPLVTLTRRLAGAVPALRDEDLAKAVGRLLLAIFLRVYAAARHAPDVVRTDDPVVLAAVAEAQREKARAEERSARLLLTSIFDRYQFEGSRTRFVNAHRHHHVDDIREAERRVGRRACRCHAKLCDRYFAAVLREVVEKGRARRLQERRQRLVLHEERRKAHADRARQEHFREHPEEAVARGLDLVASQYLPETHQLFSEGTGLGTRVIREAFEEIRRRSPLALVDSAETGWRMWVKTGPDPRAVPLGRKVFERLRQEAEKSKTPSPLQAATAILCPGSHQARKPRPSPGLDLRNSAARSGST